MGDKKTCGHDRGYRCVCHPLSDRRRRQADLVDLMSRPVGIRLAHAEQEDAGIADQDQLNDDEFVG